jgi:hypothetical protein
MSEASDIDRLLYEMLQGDTDRQHGEAILDAVAASEARRQGSAGDPILEVLSRAHQAKASEAEDSQQ